MRRIAERNDIEDKHNQYTHTRKDYQPTYHDTHNTLKDHSKHSQQHQ